MITAQLIKSLDFHTMEDYFEYVISSYINGQFTQVKALIKKMSTEDKTEFKDYLYQTGESDNTKMKITSYLL